jgi:transposase-like protein
MTHPNAWPEVDKVRALQMAEAGYSYVRIAREVGRTKHAVAAVIQRARSERGTTRPGMPDWTREEIDTLVKMSADGIKNEVIAAKIGRSLHAVARKKHDIKKATGVDHSAVERVRRVERERLPPLVREFKMRAAKCGVSITKVAHKAGCSDSSLLAWGRTDPRLSHFQAAAEVVGLRLVLVPMEDAA